MQGEKIDSDSWLFTGPIEEMAAFADFVLRMAECGRKQTRVIFSEADSIDSDQVSSVVKLKKDAVPEDPVPSEQNS